MIPDVRRLGPPILLAPRLLDVEGSIEAYAGRLCASGVPVQLTRYGGMTHGFFTMTGTLEASRQATDQVAAYLKTALM